MKSLSFRVRSQAGGSLIDQVVRGIRSVVHTGRFGAGDRLPTLNAMSAELGVSLNTTRRAVERLAAEGLLEVRRSTGILVHSTHETRFRAHVLFVTHSTPASYYYAARNNAFMDSLRKHDIHVTIIHIIQGETYAGFPTVRHILATQPVTLAVLDGDIAIQESRLMKLLGGHGVRVVETWASSPSPAIVADSLLLDSPPAYRRLARHCARCGAKEVLFFSPENASWKGFRDAARKADLEVKRQDFNTALYEGTNEVNVERDGYETVMRLIRQGRIDRGRAMLATVDDYFARGALSALLELGWRIPRDIQFASLVNIGHVPVTMVPLTRIEMYPIQHGEAMARMVMRNLRPRKHGRKPLVVRPRFVAGKSTQRAVRKRSTPHSAVFGVTAKT